MGSLMGDFVKGPLKEDGQILTRAMIVHRRLDKFTDNHPLIKSSRQRVVKVKRRYTGIAVDLFFDHFLAKNWSDLHDIPLNTFVQNIYALLQNRRDELPLALQIILPRMTKNDWLGSYRNLKSIEQALTHLGKRLRHPVNLGESITDLIENYEIFEEDFLSFIPLAQKFCNEAFSKKY